MEYTHSTPNPEGEKIFVLKVSIMYRFPPWRWKNKSVPNVVTGLLNLGLIMCEFKQVHHLMAPVLFCLHA